LAVSVHPEAPPSTMVCGADWQLHCPRNRPRRSTAAAHNAAEPTSLEPIARADPGGARRAKSAGRRDAPLSIRLEAMHLRAPRIGAVDVLARPLPGFAASGGVHLQQLT
jgi:hypothetical protein